MTFLLKTTVFLHGVDYEKEIEISHDSFVDICLMGLHQKSDCVRDLAARRRFYNRNRSFKKIKALDQLHQKIMPHALDLEANPATHYVTCLKMLTGKKHLRCYCNIFCAFDNT